MAAMSVHLGPCIVLATLARLRRGWDDRSDREIVDAVLDGRVDAYGALVRRYGRRIYAVARRIVRSHDDADDIAQEAFVRAYQSLHTFDTSRPFYTWLCRIAINLAINSEEKRRRHATDSLDERQLDTGYEPVAKEDPSELVERQELTSAVQMALAELPDGMREVFVLRLFDDLSYDQIAEVLDVPRGTVMSRLARAREHVRKKLAPYMDSAHGFDRGA
jgi:RNA polymerase sigma-70 factor (ECF subfamily)